MTDKEEMKRAAKTYFEKKQKALDYVAFPEREWIEKTAFEAGWKAAMKGTAVDALLDACERIAGEFSVLNGSYEADMAREALVKFRQETADE